MKTSTLIVLTSAKQINVYSQSENGYTLWLDSLHKHWWIQTITLCVYNHITSKLINLDLQSENKYTLWLDFRLTQWIKTSTLCVSNHTDSCQTEIMLFKG